MAVIPAGVLASASKHEAALAHVQRALSAARQGGAGAVTPFFEDGVHPSGPKWLTAWAKQNPEGHILETQIQAEPPHGGGRNATLAQTWDYHILLIEEYRPGTYRRISILVREYGPANYRIVLASKMEESQNLPSYQDFHRHLRSSSRFREHGWHRQGAWEVALEVQRTTSPTDVPYRQFTPETAFAHFKSVVAKIQRNSARSDAELRRTVRDEPLNALRKWVAANPKLEVIGYEAEDMGRGRIELRCQVRHGTQQQAVRVWIDQFGQWTLTFFEPGPLSAVATQEAEWVAQEEFEGIPVRVSRTNHHPGFMLALASDFPPNHPRRRSLEQLLAHARTKQWRQMREHLCEGDSPKAHDKIRRELWPALQEATLGTIKLSPAPFRGGDSMSLRVRGTWRVCQIHYGPDDVGIHIDAVDNGFPIGHPEADFFAPNAQR